MFRLIIIGVCGFVCWLGFDGMRVNLSGDLQTFTIEEVEENGVGDARYVEITGGDSYQGSFVYEGEESLSGIGGVKKIDKIVYPLVSWAKELEGYGMVIDSTSIPDSTFIRFEEEVMVEVSVVVDRKEINQSCLLDTSCAYVDSTATIIGLVKSGFDGLESEEKALLAELGVGFSDHFIYIDEGAEPRSFWINILMMLGSLFIGGITIFSFFRGGGE